MLATMQRSALHSSSASRCRTVRPVKTVRGIKPCGVTAKEFVEDACAIPGKIRFIMIGEGAILESVATTTPTFHDVKDKGTLATFSNDDKSFEAHVYLASVSEAKLVKGKSKQGGHDTYSIRLVDLENKPALTMLLASPDAAAVKAWEGLQAKYGDIAFFDSVDVGDALFSFSDA